MPPVTPRIVVVRGNDRGATLVLDGPEVSIGRGKDSTLVLRDLSVSRRHVLLRMSGTTVYLRDEGSGNGTLVNGVRLEGEVELTDGAQIAIGDTILVLEQPAAPRISVPAIRTRTPSIDLAMWIKPVLLASGGIGTVVLAALLLRSTPTGPTTAPFDAPPRPTPIVISVPPPDPKPDAPPAPSPTTSGSRRGPSSIEKQAAAAYAAKEFAEAAGMLRAAAERDRSTANRLTAVARDYAAVGAGLARGAANRNTNPTVALAAFKEALAADARSGQRLQATFIRSQLAQVAPAAAEAYFTSGRYAQARAACGLADPNDARVVEVRRKLAHVGE